MSAAFDYMKVPTGPQPIPTVRDALEQMAEDLLRQRVHPSVAGAKLKQLVESLKRKPPISVARKKIAPLSTDKRIAIRETFRVHPHLSQLELANMYNTNPGRVSEALNEFR